MGVTIPRQMSLGFIRKVAEQEQEKKLVSSIPPWLLVQFVLLGSCFEASHADGL